jgi:hypothetical protein
MSLASGRINFTKTLAIFVFWLFANLYLPTSTSEAQTQYQNAGKVDFYKFTDESFNQFTHSPSLRMQEWIKTRYARMLTYSPYFDSRLWWYPNAWVYKDLYAIYGNQDEISRRHPNWILKDRTGNKLYIPFGCSGGTCPQYAADVGNPQFRAHWIEKARQTLAKGYLGLFVDDVNLTWRISDGYGGNTIPIDPRTGREMTLETWQKNVAEFTEAIKASFPNKEIVHNVIWFADSPRNPFVTRQIKASNYVYLERGINDSKLRGGTDQFSLETFLSFIDYIHLQGRGVIFDVIHAGDLKNVEYGLAGWLLISEGDDGFGNRQFSSPNNWWSGYELNLGTGFGKRYNWNGVIRRDFERGIVLLNQPGMPARTLKLGQNYKTIDGRLVSTVTLTSSTGVILLKQ